MKIDDKIFILARKPRMFNKDMDVYQNVLSIYNLCKDYLSKKTNMVEIGCYSGGGTEVFLNMCSYVYAIDCWHDNLNPSQDDCQNLKKAELLFNRKIKRYKNIELIRKTSIRALKHFKTNSLDAIYIDGDHRAGGVAKDLILWYNKVKLDGIIAGHDYNDKNIRTLINEILGKPEKVYTDSSWVIRKKDKYLQ